MVICELTATLTNCNLHKKYHQLKLPPTCELGMGSYKKLVLSMLTIIIFCIVV